MANRIRSCIDQGAAPFARAFIPGRRAALGRGLWDCSTVQRQRYDAGRLKKKVKPLWSP